VVKSVGGGRLKSMAVCIHTYENIISHENLLDAWKEFIRGKKNKKDVEIFQRYLMQNVISLHNDLSSKNYKHSPYEAFNISDPKPRAIHKAHVRDRLLHHAIYRKLYP
jgi:retron-type reverse transcriptase